MTRPAIGVAGLGSMGFGIAGSLVRAGFTTYGFDINPQQVRRLEQLGGQGGALTAMAPALDILVVVVVNASQLEDVLFGEAGAAAAMRNGTVVIGCPTVAPAAARAIEARLAQAGILYLDAPISGGAVKAEAGELTVMMSGRPEAVQAAKPALASPSAAPISAAKFSGSSGVSTAAETSSPRSMPRSCSASTAAASPASGPP